MTRVNESLVDIEDCVGAESLPLINSHVLPKVSHSHDVTCAFVQQYYVIGAKKM